MSGQPMHASEPRLLGNRNAPHQRQVKSRKTKGAPACGICRTTLSHGDCLNRMCEKFVGGGKPRHRGWVMNKFLEKFLRGIPDDQVEDILKWLDTNPDAIREMVAVIEDSHRNLGAVGTDSWTNQLE